MVSAEAPRATSVLGLSGSLRVASRNTGLLRVLQHTPLDGTHFTLANLRDVPIYNDDLWGGRPDDRGLPESVRHLRAQVRGADVVVIATPEHNHNVTAALKNAIDWCSRGPNLWRNRLVTMMGAAGSSLGARGASALATTLASCGALFPPSPRDYVFVSAFDASLFDEHGDVADEKLKARIRAHTRAVADWAPKLQEILPQCE